MKINIFSCWNEDANACVSTVIGCLTIIYRGQNYSDDVT